MDAMVLKLATELLGSTSPAEGWPSLDAAVDELGREGFFGHVAVVHEACFAAMTGDIDRARDLIRESEEMARRFGAEFWATVSYKFGGEIELMGGDVEAAERAFRTESEIHQRLGDEGHGSTGAAYLALALARLGRFDEAGELAERAPRDGSRRRRGHTGVGLFRARARDVGAGEHEEALRLAGEAVRMYAPAQSPWLYGDCLMIQAEVCHAADRPNEAIDAARTALAAYERKGHRPGAASARAFLREVGAD